MELSCFCCSRAAPFIQWDRFFSRQLHICLVGRFLTGMHRNSEPKRCGSHTIFERQKRSLCVKETHSKHYTHSLTNLQNRTTCFKYHWAVSCTHTHTHTQHNHTHHTACTHTHTHTHTYFTSFNLVGCWPSKCFGSETPQCRWAASWLLLLLLSPSLSVWWWQSGWRIQASTSACGPTHSCIIIVFFARFAAFRWHHFITFLRQQEDRIEEIMQALHISRILCGNLRFMQRKCGVFEKMQPPHKCAEIGWLCVELCDRIIAFFWRDWTGTVRGLADISTVLMLCSVLFS